LLKAGAVPRFVGARLGQVQTEQGDALEVEVTLETTPSVLYDAMAVPGGHDAVEKLAVTGHALEFIKDSYRHCKPILAIGAGATLLENAGASAKLSSGESDPGVLTFDQGETAQAVREFVSALAKHRHFTREVDPPLV
jgi:catalase